MLITIWLLTCSQHLAVLFSKACFVNGHAAPKLCTTSDGFTEHSSVHTHDKIASGLWVSVHAEDT